MILYMKQIFLPINSIIRLSLYDFGGKGPPIIFCHFTGGLGRLWQSVISPLKKQYHCFAYDARGHGDSSKPNEMKYYDWNEHLSDLISIIQYIKETTHSDYIFGVGHSFGSACLSQAVIKTKTYIHWGKIVLVEPILGPMSFDFRKSKMSEIAKKRREEFKSEEEIEKTLSSKRPYKSWSVKAWKIYKKYAFSLNKEGNLSLKCSPDIESYQYLNGNPKGWYRDLKKIDIPTLLIFGENSELLILSNEQMKQLPNASLIIFPNTGHFLPLEKPLIFSQTIGKWFNTI